jgi:putative acetyltransferase
LYAAGGNNFRRTVLNIRPETVHDFEAIRAIHKAAFAHHPFSHQTEHLIVDALRTDGALAVSLVAEVNKNVVGHIAASLITIGGRQLPWYILGPLGILPAMQRQGIGKQLVENCLKHLRAIGAEGCVLVGDPAYYNRFGFRHHSELYLTGISEEFFLCLPMTDDIPHGIIKYHAAFGVEDDKVESAVNPNA